MTSPENLTEKVAAAEEQLKAYAPYLEPERKKDSSLAQELGESVADLMMDTDAPELAGHEIQSAASARDLTSGATDLTGSVIEGALELTGDILSGTLEVVGDVIGSLLS